MEFYAGALWCLNHSKSEKQRQNNNFLTGETWKYVPNTNFAYYSSMGRFAIQIKNDFPHQGTYLCTEEELKSEVNYYANIDNILNESEGYTNIDYYTQWRKTNGKNNRC